MQGILKLHFKSVITFGGDVRSKDTKAVYYLLSFLINFAASLTYATYVIFLLSNGLDLFQVMLVNLAFMIGNLIFEIPTGAYADYFGRKKSIILSNLFMIIGLLIYFGSSNLLMFVVAEVVCALAYTFSSGALDAWMVDSLEETKLKDKVDIVFSKSSIVGQAAVLIGGLVGAYIGNINLALPFGLGALIACVSFIVAIFFVHEKVTPKKVLSISKSITHIGIITKDSIKYGIRHKVVLWLIFSTVLSTFAFMPLNMYWSPRLNELAGNRVWLMGWVWAGVASFMILGGFLVKQLLKKEKTYLWILILTTLIIGAPIILIANSNIFSVVLFGFLIYEMGRGMSDPVRKSYLNKYIPSGQRATILSFDSMMGKLGAAAGLLILGWIAKNYSIQISWFISGLLLLLLIPIYIQVKKQEGLIE